MKDQFDLGRFTDYSTVFRQSGREEETRGKLGEVTEVLLG